MKKPIPALAALSCRIGRTGFPDERAFTVPTENEGSHFGSGDAHYFWKADRRPLTADEPGDDAEIDGFVAAQVLKVEGTRALVEVPDAKVIWVKADAIVVRPTEVRFDVPV
jgi:hypothetical protein